MFVIYTGELFGVHYIIIMLFNKNKTSEDHIYRIIFIVYSRY